MSPKKKENPGPKPFVCDRCGKIRYILVDGYPFGDRQLDGVIFRVNNNNGKPRVAGVVRGKEYFETLNKRLWYKACEDHCRDLDVANCPKCGLEVDVWAAGKKRPDPVFVTGISGADIPKRKKK